MEHIFFVAFLIKTLEIDHIKVIEKVITFCYTSKHDYVNLTGGWLCQKKEKALHRWNTTICQIF